MKTIQEEIQELAEAKSAIAAKASSFAIEYREGTDDETLAHNTKAANINAKIYELTNMVEMKFQDLIDKIAIEFNLIS